MPKRRPKNTETAIQAYCRINRDIETYLAEIQKGLTDYAMRQAINGGNETTNWAHVGDMAHYSGQLKNIADSLLGRDEYAS